MTDFDLVEQIVAIFYEYYSKSTELERKKQLNNAYDEAREILKEYIEQEKYKWEQKNFKK